MLYFAHRLINEQKASDFRKRLLMSSEWTDGKCLIEAYFPRSTVTITE